MDDACLSTFERAAKFIEAGDDFLVTTHFAPDGDAVGAALGMGVILTKLGKRFILAIDGGVSQKYDFLGEKESVLDSSRVTIPGIFTSIIILDAGNYKRIGAVSEMVEAYQKTKATGLQSIRLGNIGVFAGSEEDMAYLTRNVEQGAF